MDTFSALQNTDPDLAAVLSDELYRQQSQLELIASENFASPAVLAAQGSVLTNKYAEGYPGRRYYSGCEVVDRAETLAIERAKQLYGCSFANVQPHSGAQANQAVFLAVLKPGETYLGMSLDSGGHLTHGCKVNMSGKWFHAVGYGLNASTGTIDMDQVRDLAKAHSPKLIIAGGSAYARHIDFKAFREIANEVGALLMVDMAHFSGLVAGGVYPSPLPFADIVTTTTHKTLRGPRGGMILTNDADLAKKVNSAVFPGNQGGPLMHVIAAKAVAFKEALQPSFKDYAAQVVANAKALADEFKAGGLDLVSGGTDSHLLLVDLQAYGLTGKEACESLERAGITCNKNGVPNDPLPPVKTSGIRLGTPACTTRGLMAPDFAQVGQWSVAVLKALKSGEASSVEQEVRSQVTSLCQRYPLYPSLAQAA